MDARIGRDFTNLITFEFLEPELKEKFVKGELSVSDMDAIAQIRVKKNVVRQIELAKETGLNHVELDGGIPNPYLNMDEDEINKIVKSAEKHDVTLSLHLPYTFIAESTCAFQEEDRVVAVEYMKRYLDFANRIGCIGAIMHVGSIPYYQADKEYLKIMEAQAVKSLIELASYSTKISDGRMKLHLENNTRWDVALVTLEECLPVLEKVRDSGADIKFCFDLAHEFTLKETIDEIPKNPELRYNDVPAEYLSGIQIGDFIPETRLFHPLLFREEGRMKAENWKNAFKILIKKGVEFIVVETAVRERIDMINGLELQAMEARWIRSVFDRAIKELSEQRI